MKKALLLIVLIAATGLTPGNSSAIGYLENAEPNSIGIYFEEGGWCNEIYVPALSMVTAYVILAAPTEPVNGYEFGLDFEGVVTVAGTALHGFGATNVATELDTYAVGLSFPLPVTDNATLVTYSLFTTVDGPIEIYGRAVSGTFPDCRYGYRGTGSVFVRSGWSSCPPPDLVPSYCDDSNCRSLVPLAVINDRAPVGVEREMWSSLKAMYR